MKKTLFPSYYKSFCFDDMQVPDADGFEYASQVTFRLYDYDLDGSDYLGMCSVPLKDAVISSSESDVLPAPKWVPFFKETPSDGEGQILVNIQLIPTRGKTLPNDMDKVNIIPPTRKAFIEFIVIGIREMAPYHFKSIENPFIDIELQSFETHYKSSTKSSKRPNPSNPNFLEKIIMSVDLPIESIFAAPLQIKARDTRLGGFLKPIVGVCQIELASKIPWCSDTYQAPQTDVFVNDVDPRSSIVRNSIVGNVGLFGEENNDTVSNELRSLQMKRNTDDTFVASPEPISVDAFLKQRIKGEDTGAGVFGALSHLEKDGRSKKKTNAEDEFVDPDWTQDDGDEPPAWAVGRKVLQSELEQEFGTTPFETYPLMRGQKNSLLGSTLKVVGRLKGLVRVIESEDEQPLLPPEFMKDLLVPKSYKIRLYVLRGIGLAKMDVDMFGRPANSDPYLKASLGKSKFNDRENAYNDMTDCDFYKLIEFDAELPGNSILRIDVMDKDTIGYDDLIGKTTIDLEDRWFDVRWQEWGKENRLNPGEDKNDKMKVRWDTKPIERRSIYQPSKSMPQGVLECWVDIMKPEIATTFPPDDVNLPPSQIFEVRVVIWKTKNVPNMDSFEGMSDLFVKCWPEGCKPQETDTHWRCQKGKASFNWRLIFDVELGHNTKAMKFPYFHFQLWDRDLLKWNDCAGTEK